VTGIVLAIAAHPDDVEAFAGGTLAALAQNAAGSESDAGVLGSAERRPRGGRTSGSRNRLLTAAVT
jgi:LmbE family N-acetylglucosaminyl deacetylase